MTRLLVFFVFMLPSMAFSQSFINKTKKQVQKEWKKNTVNKCKPAFQNADSSMKVSACTDYSSGQSVQHIYSFDKTGKCRSEQVITNCDSCLAKLLNKVLAQTQYNWKKINENQYVSDFSSALLIELPAENKDHSITILRMDWSKELYDLLMK